MQYGWAVGCPSVEDDDGKIMDYKTRVFTQDLEKRNSELILRARVSAVQPSLKNIICYG